MAEKEDISASPSRGSGSINKPKKSRPSLMNPSHKLNRKNTPKSPIFAGVLSPPQAHQAEDFGTRVSEVIPEN